MYYTRKTFALILYHKLACVYGCSPCPDWVLITGPIGVQITGGRSSSGLVPFSQYPHGATRILYASIRIAIGPMHRNRPPPRLPPPSLASPFLISILIRVFAWSRYLIPGRKSSALACSDFIFLRSFRRFLFSSRISSSKRFSSVSIFSYSSSFGDDLLAVLEVDCGVKLRHGVSGDDGMKCLNALPIGQTIFIAIAAGTDTEPVTAHLFLMMEVFLSRSPTEVGTPAHARPNWTHHCSGCGTLIVDRCQRQLSESKGARHC